MCRRTAQAVFADLGEGGKLRIFDELNTTRDLAGLPAETTGPAGAEDAGGRLGVWILTRSGGVARAQAG